jgi:hypothetical protein
MKETIHAMDSELERYHKSNAGLDLTIQVGAGLMWFGGCDQDREAAGCLVYMLVTWLLSKAVSRL